MLNLLRLSQLTITNLFNLGLNLFNNNQELIVVELDNYLIENNNNKTSKEKEENKQNDNTILNIIDSLGDNGKKELNRFLDNLINPLNDNRMKNSEYIFSTFTNENNIEFVRIEHRDTKCCYEIELNKIQKRLEQVYMIDI